MERDCESELSKLNIEQNACIYHFGASVIHGQRSNILRLLCIFFLLLFTKVIVCGKNDWKEILKWIFLILIFIAAMLFLIA